MSYFGVGIGLSFVFCRTIFPILWCDGGLSLGNDFLELDLVDFGDRRSSSSLDIFFYLTTTTTTTITATTMMTIVHLSWPPIWTKVL